MNHQCAVLCCAVSSAGPVWVWCGVKDLCGHQYHECWLKYLVRSQRNVLLILQEKSASPALLKLTQFTARWPDGCRTSVGPPHKLHSLHLLLLCMRQTVQHMTAAAASCQGQGISCEGAGHLISWMLPCTFAAAAGAAAAAAAGAGAAAAAAAAGRSRSTPTPASQHVKALTWDGPVAL
jgi:hypothetical protein